MFLKSPSFESAKYHERLSFWNQLQFRDQLICRNSTHALLHLILLFNRNKLNAQVEFLLGLSIYIKWVNLSVDSAQEYYTLWENVAAP